MGKVKFSHIWRSLFILLSQAENKFESVNFIIQSFILNINFSIIVCIPLIFNEVSLFVFDFERRFVSL